LFETNELGVTEDTSMEKETAVPYKR